MTGVKHDAEKPDFSMVSWELMEEVAFVRMFGACKYARDNWRKGFKVTRSCAAALRHIFKFLSGETNDPESGRSHLAHAVCSLEHAIYDMHHHPENDDRYKAPTPESHEPPYTIGGMEVDKESYELWKRDHDYASLANHP
jgi:hypothetical protein